MEKYTKNQNIYSCISGEHMCVLECIYISVYKEEYKKLNGCAKIIIPRLKKFYNELFNKKFPEKFDGLDIIKTLKLAANKYEIKFIIYNHDENERLQHLNTIGTGDNIHNLLMINGVEESTNSINSASSSSSNINSNNANNSDSSNISSNNGSTVLSNNIITHVMYIKDIQKYTKLHLSEMWINLTIKIDLKSMSKIVMVV
jgi:hypothetical protein